MRKYTLFSEFCNIDIYGDSLADALVRAKTLPTPSRYENYAKVEGTGRIESVGAILGIEDVSTSNRGGKTIEAVVCEIDGRPCRVDAIAGEELKGV